VSKKHNEDEKWKRQSHEGGQHESEYAKAASSEEVKTAEECSTENDPGNAGGQGAQEPQAQGFVLPQALQLRGPARIRPHHKAAARAFDAR